MNENELVVPGGDALPAYAQSTGDVGGLAGMAGASEIMGLKHRLFDNFSPGYGLDAIVIAFLAKSNPLGVLLASLFFGALRSGAGMMQRATGVPTTAVMAIQGLVILFVAISLVLPQWRPKWFASEEK